VDAVAFYDKPLVSSSGFLLTYAALAPKGIRSFYEQVPSWLSEKLFNRAARSARSWATRAGSTSRHTTCPRRRRPSSLPVGGGGVHHRGRRGRVGNHEPTAVGRGNRVEILKEITFPHVAGAAVLGLHVLHGVSG
jgi:carbamoyltransferase